ncbi:MAG: anti-sigma factor family protein [Planctomycetaceae bacterium]
MTCREARADIALYAGGDLDDRARVRELRLHVAGCPECREHYQSLKTTLKTLSGLGPVELGGATWQSTGSLWPAIRQEIGRPPEPLTVAKAFKQLKPWAPLAAMTVACVLMLVSLGNLGTPSHDPVSMRGMLPTQPPTAMRTLAPPPSQTESTIDGLPDRDQPIPQSPVHSGL